MEGEIKFSNRKLIIDQCGFKNFILTPQFLVLNKIDRFLMTESGLKVSIFHLIHSFLPCDFTLRQNFYRKLDYFNEQYLEQ